MIKYFLLLTQIALVFPSIIRSDVAKWVKIDNFESIPKKSIRGGLDKNGQETYICSSLNPTTNNMIPGSLSKDGVCKIIDGGNEVSLDKGYRVLTNVDGVWVPFFDSKIPTNALETGQFDNNGDMFELYSGRKRFEEELRIGKILYTGVGYGQGFYGVEGKQSGDEEIFTAVPKILFLNMKVSNRMTFDGFFVIFKVKSSNAFINLGEDEEDDTPRYQITFDNVKNETSVELKKTGETFIVPSFNIISNEEMRGFWIFLDSSLRLSIKVGREGSPDPILTLNGDQFNTNNIWVQFGSNTESEWRIPTYKSL